MKVYYSKNILIMHYIGATDTYTISLIVIEYVYILLWLIGFTRESARDAATKIGIPVGRLDEVFII